MAITQEPIILRTLDFRGGAVDRSRPWTIPEQALAFIENLNISSPGAMFRRDGAQSIGGASGATNANLPYGLFRFFDRATFGTEVLYSVNGGKLFLWPGTFDVLEKACGASLTNALHMASRGIWTSALDTLYISNAQIHDSNVSLASRLLAINIDQNFSQTGSMAPLCTTWWQGRLWVGGNRLQGDNETLWWSSLNDGLLFSTTNTLRVEPGRGGRITALVPPRGESPQLLIFKEDIIALLTAFWGSSSALIPVAADALDAVRSSIRVVAENVGCVATRSVQYVPGAGGGDIFFLSKDGVRTISRATGDDTISGSGPPLSARIQEQIERINFSYAHKAAAGVWNNQYHLAVPMDGATENSHVLTYDLVSDAWFLNDWDAKDFALAQLNQDRVRLMFQNNVFTNDTARSGLVQGWHVFRGYEGEADPGNHPVRYSAETRAYDFGNILQRKKGSWFGILASSPGATAQVNIQYRLDNGLWADLGSLTFPQQSENLITLGVDPLPWGPEGVAIAGRKISLEDLSPFYTLQLRILQTGASDFGPIEFNGFAVAARPIAPEFDNTIT